MNGSSPDPEAVTASAGTCLGGDTVACGDVAAALVDGGGQLTVVGSGIGPAAGQGVVVTGGGARLEPLVTVEALTDQGGGHHLAVGGDQ